MKMMLSFRSVPGSEVFVSLCWDSQPSVIDFCVVLSRALHEEDANIPELRFVPAEPAHLQEQLVGFALLFCSSDLSVGQGVVSSRKVWGSWLYHVSCSQASRALCCVGTVTGIVHHTWRASPRTEDVPRVLGNVCAES